MATDPAVLCLDVGGSSVKSGVVLRSGDVVVGPSRARIHSRGTAEQVVNGLAAVLLELRRRAEGLDVHGIGVAMPGPFDYRSGVSAMRGLRKYDAIHGLPLAEAVVESAPILAELSWRWINDAHAFTLGELRFGAAVGVKRAMFLTIGTGCGSAFAVDGEIVTSGEGVPDGGYVYPLEYQGTIIDDLLSGRGLVRLWREEVESRSARAGSAGAGSAHAKPGAAGPARADPAGAGSVRTKPGSAGARRYSARQVGLLAEKEDGAALEAFRRFGTLLATALAPVYAAFKPDLVVLGGQVSRSLPHFGPAAAESGAPPLTLAAAPELAALRGAAVNFFESGGLG